MRSFFWGLHFPFYFSFTVYLPHHFFAPYSCLTWELIPKTSICSHIVCVISSWHPPTLSIGNPTSLHPSNSVINRYYPQLIFCNRSKQWWERRKFLVTPSKSFLKNLASTLFWAYSFECLMPGLTSSAKELSTVSFEIFQGWNDK